MPLGDCIAVLAVARVLYCVEVRFHRTSILVTFHLIPNDLRPLKLSKDQSEESLTIPQLQSMILSSMGINFLINLRAFSAQQIEKLNELLHIQND